MTSISTSAKKRESDRWTSAERMTCWSCGSEHQSSFFCPACNAIQPFPEHADYFAVLGLPHSLRVDMDTLQKRYYELHRQLHPDLFQTGAPEARQASVRNTAAVNQAFRTLRDPVDRGLYWLTLQGEALGANNNRVPHELAALVFEVQEKLEELRDARGQTSEADQVDEIRQIRNDLRRRESDLTERLLANFAQWDEPKAEPIVLRSELKTILSDLAYLSTLIRDVDRELEH